MTIPLTMFGGALTALLIAGMWINDKFNEVALQNVVAKSEMQKQLDDRFIMLQHQVVAVQSQIASFEYRAGDSISKKDFSSWRDLLDARNKGTIDVPQIRQ